MQILLQSNELAQDITYLIPVIAVLVAIFFLTRYYQRRQVEHQEDLKDPRNNVVNDSNYNINREGIDGHRTDVTSPEEAKKAIETLKKTGEMPTDEEFHDLKGK